MNIKTQGLMIQHIDKMIQYLHTKITEDDPSNIDDEDI